MLRKRSYRRISDARLLEMAQSGREKAFDELLFRHQPGIYRFVLRMTGNRQDAEDIAQESFLRLYAHAENLDPASGVRPYLYRIARNLAIDTLRKVRHEPSEFVLDAMADHVSPFRLMARRESADAILAAIGQLSHNQRDALLLKHGEGFSYAEIAAALDVSVSAVESLLVRARKNLRAALQSEESLSGGGESFPVVRDAGAHPALMSKRSNE